MTIMKMSAKALSIFIFSLILAGCGAQTQKPPQIPALLSTGTMKLTSTDFTHEGQLSARFTCDGEDINPALDIALQPDGAKSLALIVDDPDAPAGTFTHWLVWNIDKRTTRIEANTVPLGSVQGLNDFGRAAWGGPCPPSGAHRYYFKLYALDTELSLPEGASVLELQDAMTGHVLEEAVIMGTYTRG